MSVNNLHLSVIHWVKATHSPLTDYICSRMKGGGGGGLDANIFV